MLTILYMGFLAFLSLSPEEHHPGKFEHLKDTIHNLGHIPAYTILCFLWIQFLGLFHQKNFIIALSISVFYGITLEYFQSFIPGRYPSLLDICSNTLGASLTWFYLKNLIRV